MNAPDPNDYPAVEDASLSDRLIMTARELEQRAREMRNMTPTPLMWEVCVIQFEALAELLRELAAATSRDDT